ncbi:MAG: hypothetical protein QF464_06055, partial [Myxococcota bacterium]|nr:hypothetical protein [Myxococcota bacterium]
MRSQVLLGVCATVSMLWAMADTPSRAAEGPRWQSMAQPRAPKDALRVYGNKKPAGGAARATYERRRLGTRGRWANPVLCRVKYRRSYLPGELDQRAGVCVLFKRTRNGAESRCRSRDGICRVHVPVGGHVQVLRGASALHLVELSPESVASGTVGLDGEGLAGDWRLCLSDGHVGVVHREGGECQNPLATAGAHAAF